MQAGKTYLVNKELIIPANKTLDGLNSTIINKLSAVFAPVGISGSNVTIKNTRFSYQAPLVNGELVGVCLDLGAGVKNVTVDHCTFVGANAIAGVHINNPDIENVHVTNSTFNNMYYGVLYNTTNLSASERQTYNMHLSGLTVSGNTMSNLQADGVSINSPVYAYSPYCSNSAGVSANDITISNNTIYAPNSKKIAYGFCISIAGATNVVISDNSLLNCKWQGVHIEDSASNITIIRNYIYNIIGNEPDDEESWSGGRSGIWVAGSNQVWILDNHIEKTIDEGIILIGNTSLYKPCSGSYPTHNTTCAIAANRILNAGTYGISVGGPNGVDVDFYIGPIQDQELAGNTVTNSGVAPYILVGSPSGVTVTGNSW